MSNALTTAREAVAETLKDALDVRSHATMPDRIIPPTIITLPGTPYLTTSGTTFRSFTFGLDVVLVADAKVSSTGSETLDGLIDDAVVALVNSGVGVLEVSEPWQLSSGTATYLAATISTTQPIYL